MLGLATAGCAVTGQTALVADARGITVTIESIHGPPAPILHKYIRALNAEAAEREIALVLWGGAANYRLRGYLAIHPDAEPPTITWAWDVYNTAQQRVFRLTGEERIPGGRKSWAAADDTVLRQIVHVGMERLSVFMASARSAGRH